MTRNNLDEHLSWLLHITATIPAADSSLPAVPITSTTGEASPEQPDEDQVEPIARAIRNTSNTEAYATPQRSEEMARLRTAPGSASRPSLVSMGPRMPDVTTQSQPTPAQSRGPGPSYSRPVLPISKTPSRQAGQIARSPEDVEVMDLTESLSQMRSPTINRTAGRKRKSSELEPDTPRQTHPLRQPGTSNSNAAQVQSLLPPNASQQSFTAIDEIMEEPLEPPPPYSTMAPRHLSPTRRQRTATNVPAPGSSSTLSHEPARIMADSEEDDDDEMLVDFTGSGSRSRRRQLASAAKVTTSTPTQRRLGSPLDSPTRRGAVTQRGGDTKQSRVHATGTPQSVAAPFLQTLAAPRLTPAASTQVSSQQFARLLFFFGRSEKEIHKLVECIDAKMESLGAAITDRMDDDEDTDELEHELNGVRDRRKAVLQLSNQREAYQELSAEKERLKAAMKQAVIAGEGKNEAKAANDACKNKLKDVEDVCLRHLELCQQDVEDVFGHLERLEENAGSKSVAVHSTQSLPYPGTVLQPSIQSSSRIVQTQVPKLDFDRSGKLDSPRSKSNINPSNIDAYFSSARQRTYGIPERKPAFAPRVTTTHDDMLDDTYGDTNDDNMHAMNNALFSNRMGTPPAPFDTDDEDDFGIGDDDDMLGLAEDIENNGLEGRTSYQSTSRAVFAETSGNSQPHNGHTSAKKPKKTPAKLDDANLEQLFRFPWGQDVKSTLKERFKLRGFRENQLQAINATLSGKDAFVLMPTGGGKSLCYQLPALIASGKTRGVTVVISPLLSLMEDQVQHLRRLHIQAFLVNGETTQEERNAVYEALRERDVQDYMQLLYVTPEMVSKSQNMIDKFEALYRRQKLARLVIDEAHCVSQWGHDFRPDYKLLGDLRRKFPGVPVMALTATATENVKVDVLHNLGMKNSEVFTQSFNRPNLHYEVQMKGKKKESIQNIASLIKENHAKQTGIIYCLARQECEDIAKELDEQHNIRAHHYHAKMEPKDKSEVQKQWQAGKYRVIVATIAFGMGIDKADVRFVIHHSIPKSIEGYYQETGRAGRDGKKSSCYLLYGFQDAGKLRRMIDEGEGSREQKERQTQMLRKMVQYCENKSDCRRVQVLSYFGENFRQDDCEGQCDNCNSTSSFETVDFTDYAKQAISLVRQIAGDRVTILHCVDAFRGVSNKKIADRHHNRLDEYGAGKHLDRGDLERFFYRLVTEDLIREDNVMNRMGFATQYVILGRKCEEFELGKKRLHMQVHTSPAPKPKPKPPVKRKRKNDVVADTSVKTVVRKAVRSMAPPELPLSTNVSSPIPSESTRTKQSKSGSKLTVRDGRHANGYYRDDFVVEDPEDDNFANSNEESGDDTFAPIRVKGKPKREKTKDYGPPITSDNVMDGLDDIHRMVVDDFVRTAQQKAKEIMLNKNLRAVPFTDTTLRQMAVRFTVTEAQMLSIPGIDQERVKLYGKQFGKIMKEMKSSYDEMMSHGDLGPDPNARNVIDLVSDEEDDEDDYGSFDASDFEDEDDGEPSAYFQPSKNVQAFNARFAASQSEAMRTAAAQPSPPTMKPPPKAKKQYRATDSTGAGVKRRSDDGGSRHPSTSYNGHRGGRGGRGSSRAKKGWRGKRSSGSGARGGYQAAGDATRRNGGGGGGGISMMPT